jgi:hypothetical protein
VEQDLERNGTACFLFQICKKQRFAVIGTSCFVFRSVLWNMMEQSGTKKAPTFGGSTFETKILEHYVSAK